MWSTIEEFVKRHQMLDGVDKVVIGLSGGADSVCLARYLLRIRERGGPDLIAVHVNHMLREQEAERDQEFVRNFCETWKIPLFVYQENVKAFSREHKLSLEEAGRTIRYECFKKTMDAEGDTTMKLALAHHADDLAETMIFRMIRGTGPMGLVAMRPVAGDRIRPLLCVEKEHILNILKRLGQDYVEDSTNLDVEYSRNYIRHRILPDMKKINPQTVRHLCSLSEQEAALLSGIQPDIDRICKSLIKKTEEGYELPLPRLQKLNEYASMEVLRKMICLSSEQERDIGVVHVRQLQKLSGCPDGKKIDLPYGITARRREDKLIIGKKDVQIPGKREAFNPKVIKLPEFEAGRQWLAYENSELTLTLRYDFREGQQIIKRDCEKYFDYDTINHNLTLRTRQEGDYFVFDGQGRRKRLNRYFIDNKIPMDQRDRQLLLTQDSHVLWILGARISEACKVTEKTRRILTVTVSRTFH